MSKPEKLFLMRAKQDMYLPDDASVADKFPLSMRMFMCKGEIKPCVGASTIQPYFDKEGVIREVTYEHTTEFFDFFHAKELVGREVIE